MRHQICYTQFAYWRCLFGNLPLPAVKMFIYTYFNAVAATNHILCIIMYACRPACRPANIEPKIFALPSSARERRKRREEKKDYQCKTMSKQTLDKSFFHFIFFVFLTKFIINVQFFISFNSFVVNTHHFSPLDGGSEGRLTKTIVIICCLLESIIIF